MPDWELPPPPSSYASRMQREADACELVNVGPDCFGRDAYLTREAASAWQSMCFAAASDGVELLLVSAYRSVERQAEILAGKLARGMSLEEALEYSAYPGFSEHHTGEAVDLGTTGARHLEEEFEHTAAFRWLLGRAADFSFHLSYPRGNPSGIAYEPWHWRFRRG